MKRSNFLKTLLLVPVVKVEIKPIQEENDEFGTYDECFEDYDLPEGDDGEGNHGYAPNVRARY